MANSELNLDTQYALAKSDDTPAEVLHKLACSRHIEIKRLVALNPNTSREDLLRLSKDYGDEVYQNVAFSLAQREYPEDRFVQLVTARSTHASPKQLEKYAKSTREDILIAVGRNRLTPVHVLEGLVLNPSPLETGPPYYEDTWHYAQNRIYGAIAANPNTPIHTLRKLSEKQKEPDGGIYPVDRERMTGLASNPNTPTDILENILKRYDGFLPESVLTAFIDNPATPYSVLADLAHCPINEPWDKFHYSAFSDEERQRLRACKESLHLRIKQHPNAQAHLEILDEQFAFINGSQKTSSEYIDHFVLNESLTKSLTSRNRWIATAHPHTSTGTLEKLMHFPYPDKSVLGKQMLQYRIAHHPNVSSHILEAFVHVLASTPKFSLEAKSNYYKYAPYDSGCIAKLPILFLAESLYIIGHSKVTAEALGQLQLFCEELKQQKKTIIQDSIKYVPKQKHVQQLSDIVTQVLLAISQRRETL